MHRPGRSRPLLSLLAVALLLLVTARARAELAPASEAFEIVPSITFPPQVDPSGGAGDLTRSAPVVAAVTGGFAVAWVEETLFDEEVQTSAVRGRMVDAGGELGEPFDAAPSTPAWPLARVANPSLAGLGEGRFLLAFARGHAEGRELWLQHFGPGRMVELGDDAPLTGAPRLWHDLPSVSATTGGRAAVAWNAAHVGFAGEVTTTLHALALDPDGEPRTVELTLGPTLRRYVPRRPAIAVDRSGRFTAAWTVPNTGATGAVWTQSFTAEGVELARPVRVGTLATGGVAVARSGAGSVLVWARRTTIGMQLRAERLSARGRRLAATVVLASDAVSFDSPVLAPVPGRGWVLAWLDGDRLLALHLGADLAPHGPPLEVAAALPALPGVVAHGIGAAVAGKRVLLAWAGPLPDGLCPGNAIVGQLFDVLP